MVELKLILGVGYVQFLESKGFKLIRTKTNYLEYKFSDILHESNVEIRLDT